MNFSRYLPIIIALLGIFVVLGGWKAGQRTARHASDASPFSDRAPSMVRMAVQAVAPAAEGNASGNRTNAPAADAPEAALPQKAATGEPTANTTGGPPEQKPSPTADAPSEPGGATAKASPAGQAEKPDPRDAARVLVDGYAQNRTLFTVRVAASADIPACSWFTLNDPRRIVVDVRGRWDCPDAPLYRVGPGFISAVVVGEHPAYLRLVLRLGDGSGFPDFALDQRKREVVLVARRRGFN